MWTDLKQAAREATLLGVKVAIVALIGLFAVAWALNDYTVVRQQALHGQQAFEYLAQQQEAQRAQTAAPTRRPDPAPVPAQPAP